MTVEFRDALPEDLPRIVRLLADDPLGATREVAGADLPEAYGEALAAIGRDPNNRLAVALSRGQIVGVLQMTFIPSLTYTGSWRMQVEGVRVAEESRGAGVGRQMMQWAIEEARKRDCRLVQLTTDRRRPEALRFYESLGFVASHAGMKLHLVPK